MRALILIMLLIAVPAAADSEARYGNDFVRVTATPCTDAKVLVHIAAMRQDANDYRAARARFQSAEFAACWRPMFEQKVIVVVYEDGDQDTLPFADLKRVKEA